MDSYIQRLGKFIRADEVFHAWYSGDLRRMVAALRIQTNPIDRHFLLMGIVGLTYKNRTDAESRRLCREVARLHISEFPSIRGPLRADLGVLPRASTFAQLATVLAEDGEFNEAISVCRQALAFGLSDGTKGDYAGRIERLRKKMALSAPRDA